MCRKLYVLIWLIFLYSPRAGKAQLSNFLLRSEGDIPLELITSEYEKLQYYKKNMGVEELNYYRSLVISMQNMIENNSILYGNYTQKYLQELADEIRSTNNIPARIQIFQINSTEVNAFSIEPGYIFVSTGLLAGMMSEDNLYMVLCHEIAHITNNHSKKFYEKKTQFAKKEALSGINPVEDFLKNILSYSREQEKEADITGIKYYLKSGRRSSEIIKTYSLLSADSMMQAPWVDSFFTSLGLTRDYCSEKESFSMGSKTGNWLRISGSDTSQANRENELWRSHPSSANRLDYVKNEVGTITEGVARDEAKFREVHKACLLNYALLSKIGGDFLNSLHAKVLYEYQYGKSKDMDIIAANAVANVLLINSSEYKKKDDVMKNAQPGIALMISKQLRSDSGFANHLIGLFTYLEYSGSSEKNLLAPYCAAVRYRLMKSSNNSRKDLGPLLKDALTRLYDDNSFESLEKVIKIEEIRQDSILRAKKALQKRFGVENLYLDHKYEGEGPKIKTVSLFQVYTFMSSATTNSIVLKNRLLKYTRKELKRINKITEIHINDSFVERRTLTTEVLNDGFYYTLLMSEGHSRTNKELPLIISSQIEGFERMKESIAISMVLVPDIYSIYNTNPKKSVLLFLSVQQLSADEPLYLFVRITKGRLQPGVLGNYIYNAVMEAQSK